MGLFTQGIYIRNLIITLKFSFFPNNFSCSVQGSFNNLICCCILSWYELENLALKVKWSLQQLHLDFFKSFQLFMFDQFEKVKHQCWDLEIIKIAFSYTLIKLPCFNLGNLGNFIISKLRTRVCHDYLWIIVIFWTS